MGDLFDTSDVPLSKGQQEWNLMKKDPYYNDDPLCHEAHDIHCELLYCASMLKKSGDVSKMTYEQLITWEKYTDKQILNMVNGPIDARWSPSRWPGDNESRSTAFNHIRDKYNRKLQHERNIILNAEKEKMESIKKRNISKARQSEVNEQRKIMEEKKRAEKIKEDNKLIKLQKDKEILEFVDNFIPETILEKLAYAQYIQIKRLGGISNQLNDISSRIP